MTAIMIKIILMMMMMTTIKITSISCFFQVFLDNHYNDGDEYRQDHLWSWSLPNNIDRDGDEHHDHLWRWFVPNDIDHDGDQHIFTKWSSSLFQGEASSELVWSRWFSSSSSPSSSSLASSSSSSSSSSSALELIHMMLNMWWSRWSWCAIEEQNSNNNICRSINDSFNMHIERNNIDNTHAQWQNQ